MENFGDAFILCGGKSSRMNFDKSFLKIEDRYVLDIICDKLSLVFDNVKLSARDSKKYSDFSMPVIQDLYNDGIGPIAAIHAALVASNTRYIFVCACDMPFVNPWYIEFMKSIIEEHNYGIDALIPINKNKKEATHAFYSKDSIKKFEDEINNERYKMQDIVNNKLNSKFIEEEYSRAFDSGLSFFTNLNYKEDLVKFNAKWI